MSPVARSLTDTLLAHHRHVCGPHSFRPPITDRCLITYGVLCRDAGYAGMVQGVVLLSQLTEPRPWSSGRKRLGPGVPVVDPSLLVTPQDTTDRLGDLPRRRGAFSEEFGEDRPHLRHGHRRGFPPRVASAPGRGTTRPKTRA